MAANSTTETWDAAWTTMARTKRKRLTDNIFDEYPTLGYLKASNRVEVEEGGKEIQEDVMYGKNSLEWFSGYDVVNTDAVDGITAAFFPWRFAAVPITISLEEKNKARKADSAMGLLESKTQQSMKTAQDGINAAIYSAQTGKTMLGFQDIIATGSSSGFTATNTLGGINRTNESWYSNYVYTASTNMDGVASNIISGAAAINTMVNNASSGNNTPDKAFTTLTLFGDLQNVYAGTGTARLSAGDKGKAAGGLGADNHPQVGPVTVSYDRDCPSGKVYVINPKAIKLKIMKGMNFAKTPFKEPSNQFAMVSFIVVGIQMTSPEPRRLALGTAFT